MIEPKEKAAGVLPAPEAAIQNPTKFIIVGDLGRVNATVPHLSMAQAIRLAGLAPHNDIDLVSDGIVHRYRVEGDKAGSKNGWYVMHDSPPAGAFGSWKTNESHTWHEVRAKPHTPQELAALRGHLQKAQKARAVEQGRVHAEARVKAERLWRQAVPASSAHPYLQRKLALAGGIRQLGQMLVIPARDASGTLHTLQFIGPDGSKRFLSGGRIAGCYFALGRPGDVLLLCEGFATGSSLHQATGRAVAVAFNCGNLTPVALALRAKFRHMRILVCADDDAGTPGNPGVTKANEAARAVGGAVAVPRFKGAANV